MNTPTLEMTAMSQIVTRLCPMAEKNNNVFAIPSNMRIAGRVTGNGLFHLTADDIALQQALDQQQQQQQKKKASTAGLKAWSTIAKTEQNFPTLGSTQQQQQQQQGNNNSNSSNNNKVSNKPNTLTEILKSVASATDSKSKGNTSSAVVSNDSTLDVNKALFDRRQQMAQRSIKLAKAFGLTATATAPATSTLHDPLYNPTLFSLCHASSALMTNLNNSNNSSLQFLKKELYPPFLLQFARRESAELGKLEKKLNDFINNNNNNNNNSATATASSLVSNSMQLKPMANPELRYCLMVMMSLYFRVNVVEYADSDASKKYLNIVKRTDSKIPAVLLSTTTATTISMTANATAAALALATRMSLMKLNSPCLFFCVQDKAVSYTPSINHYLHDVTTTASTTSISSVFTVADVIGYLSTILSSDPLHQSVLAASTTTTTSSSTSPLLMIDFQLLPSSLLKIEFKSKAVATHVHQILQQHSIAVHPQAPPRRGSSSSNATNSSSTSNVSMVPFMDVFDVLCGFDVEVELKAMEASMATNPSAQMSNIKTRDDAATDAVVVDIDNDHWISSLQKNVNNKINTNDIKLNPYFQQEIQEAWNDEEEQDGEKDKNNVEENDDDGSFELVDSVDACELKPAAVAHEEDARVSELLSKFSTLSSPCEGEEKWSSGKSVYHHLALQPRTEPLPEPTRQQLEQKQLLKLQQQQQQMYQQQQHKLQQQKEQKAKNFKAPAKKVVMTPSFSLLSAHEDEDDDGGDEEEEVDPSDETVTALASNNNNNDVIDVIADVEDNEGSNNVYAHRTWTCSRCTLDNEMYYNVTSDNNDCRVVECEACGNSQVLS